MTKLAVVHIITRLDLGGAQKSCLALVSELQRNHPEIECYLITGTTGKLIPEAKQLKNLILLDYLKWAIHPINDLRAMLKIITQLKQLKHKHKSIIVHTHTIKAGTIGRWAALFAGIKIRIHTIHGFSFHSFQNKLIWLVFYLVELINSLITTQFICVSSEDQQAGSEIFPNFRFKSTIIRAATIPELKDNTNPQPKNLLIGTMASLKPGKNLFELIKAYQYAQQFIPQLKLEIIGEGPLRPAIESLIKKDGLTKKVKLLGASKNPAIYYKNWDCFVFTSLWEGLPCAIVEALNQGLPVISYNTGGICDLIEPKKLVLQGKWRDIGSQLADLYTTPQMWTGKPHLEPFKIPNMALDHVKLYYALAPF